MSSCKTRVDLSLQIQYIPCTVHNKYRPFFSLYLTWNQFAKVCTLTLTFRQSSLSRLSKDFSKQTLSRFIHVYSRGKPLIFVCSSWKRVACLVIDLSRVIEGKKNCRLCSRVNKRGGSLAQKRRGAHTLSPNSGVTQRCQSNSDLKHSAHWLQPHYKQCNGAVNVLWHRDIHLLYNETYIHYRLVLTI